MAIESINPATGSTNKTYQTYDSNKVDQLLKAAAAAQLEWQELEVRERAPYMNKVATLLREQKHDLAALMTMEMGKPLQQGVAEAEKCAWACEYYAEQAESFLSATEIESDASHSEVVYRPLGVVLAIMPWNFPLWQVFRFTAPSLMAGNSGVLKHASNVPGCALRIEQLMREAGFPEGLFATLLVKSADTAALIEHSTIKAISLTGSVNAGRAVAAKAGEMLKKTVLELGGSDPYIILEDADLDLAAESCVASRLINSGQSCIAAKRFIAVKEIYKEFENRVVELMSSRKMGDPTAEDTDIGPQAREDLRDSLHEQVTRSVNNGASRLLGGVVPDGAGAYYPATLLGNVNVGMAAYNEELFGPVAALIRADDTEHAIHIANDTVFGLGAAVFTGDVEKGQKIASERLQAGCCFVNDFVRSDPRLPFGGINQSGYGRELGPVGIHEFVNIKTVYVA